MKAIVTKYHGATNTRGSRVSATAEGGNRISLPWDDALNSEENHRKAALALVVKMKWTFCPLISGGGLPNLDTVHMFSPELKEAVRTLTILGEALTSALSVINAESEKPSDYASTKNQIATAQAERDSFLKRNELTGI